MAWKALCHCGLSDCYISRLLMGLLAQSHQQVPERVIPTLFRHFVVSLGGVENSE